jgi:hypothetical protein
MKINHVGEKYGKLEVIEHVGYDHSNKLIVLCRCECGNLKKVRKNNLGCSTNSCGCYKKEYIKKTYSKSLEHLEIMRTLNACRRKTKDTNLTYDVVKQLIFSNCFYCEQKPEDIEITSGKFFTAKNKKQIKRVGIDRINNNIGYYKNNVVPCCLVCNTIKRDFSVDSLIPKLSVMIKNIKSLYDSQKEKI